MVSKQVAAILTILGGAFYIIGAFVGIIASAGFLFGLFGVQCSTFSGLQCSTISASKLGEAILAILIFGIFTGALMITGGALLNSDSSSRRKSGGILAIAMMIIGALPTLGGLGIGFLLALIGSVIGLTYKGEPDIVVGVSPIATPVSSTATTTSPSQRRTTKYCIKCGTPLDEGAVFCGNCGAPLPSRPAS